MANEYISMRNLHFLLKEVFDIQQLQTFERYQDYDEQAVNLSLDAAKQIGDKYLFPFYREMDKNKAYYADGEVHVSEAVGKAMRALGEGGWISATDSYEAGGGQMPWMLMNAGLSIFYAANCNAAAYGFLTQGAANLIRTFGSQALKDTYIQKMYSGEWQGTMALTEPQAGSSLSDITSSARPQEDGSYQIKGQKIYISGGDHTGADNIIHLLLARIDGAVAGTKGISLFVVPKHRIDADGQLTNNDVTTAGIYGKMGQKGYVAAHLMMGEKDDCRGYLVGEPHRGLIYMFQMMNEARIGTGLFATGNASAAYYASLQYAKERPQGRHPSNKDVTQPQVLIHEHADVKRMLLLQKSVVEGSFSLLMECSRLADLSHEAVGKEKEEAHLLLELLTPIAKSYPSEMGVVAVSNGMQVLGGAGYTDDFPLEQIYRDIRVNAIYEGTTTIHGMDLLGRKMMMNNGAAAQLLAATITDTIKAASQHENLQAWAQKLGVAATELQKVTATLIKLAMDERPEVFLADATLYLELTSLTVIGWQWLKQAVKAQERLAKQKNSTDDQHFYRGKLNTCRYFFAYELPKRLGLEERLLENNRVTLEMKIEEF